jgi:hypothetical protein
MTTIDRLYLSRNDIDKINAMLKKFSDIDSFMLTQESGSGIGNVLSISFDYSINDTQGKFTTEISGIEDW